MSALSRASSFGILGIFEELLLGLSEEEEEELGERRGLVVEDGEVLEVWGLVDEEVEIGGDKELGLLLVARLLERVSLGGLIVLAVVGSDDLEALVSFLLLLVDSWVVRLIVVDLFDPPPPPPSPPPVFFNLAAERVLLLPLVICPPVEYLVVLFLLLTSVFVYVYIIRSSSSSSALRSSSCFNCFSRLSSQSFFTFSISNFENQHKILIFINLDL